MDEVIKQAPSDIAVEDIEVIFKKNNENVLDTLFDLWNIEVKDAKSTKSTKSTKSVKKDDDEAEAAEEDDAELDFTNPETKWENIRNICDAYDIEMQAHLNRLKGK
jgi:hypothetical protein